MPGVDMVEIRVDRHDGAGIVFVAITTHARFTDHHELPAERTIWTYYLNFITRDGIPVGVQSVCEVVGQVMAGTV